MKFDVIILRSSLIRSSGILLVTVRLLRPEARFVFCFLPEREKCKPSSQMAYRYRE